MSGKRSLEDRLGWLLVGGVAISMTLVVAGTVISFLHHPDYLWSRSALERLTGGAAAPRSLRVVFAALANLRGQALVMVGLLLLVSTPVARVVVSLVAFARARDRIYVALTSAVLLLLTLSLLLGRAGG